MSKIEVGEVAARLFGVYLIVLAIIRLEYPLAAVAMSRQDGTQDVFMVISSFAPSIVLAAVGRVFFVFSNRIAGKIMPPETGDPSPASLSSLEIHSLVISAVGLLLLGLNIPAFILLLLQNIQMYQDGLPVQNYMRDRWWSLLTEGLQVVFGIYLFFGAKTISVFWHRLRGMQEIRPSQDQ